MAVIRVEKQTGIPLWTGWLGLLALAALIWVLFALGSSAKPHSEATMADRDVIVLTDDDAATGHDG